MHQISARKIEIIKKQQQHATYHKHRSPLKACQFITINITIIYKSKIQIKLETYC